MEATIAVMPMLISLGRCISFTFPCVWRGIAARLARRGVVVHPRVCRSGTGLGQSVSAGSTTALLARRGGAARGLTAPEPERTGARERAPPPTLLASARSAPEG